jgi:hypothetical protein
MTSAFIGPWPKHPQQRKPYTRLTIHGPVFTADAARVSYNAGHKREQTTAKRLILVDGEAQQLGTIASRLRVPPRALADAYRPQSLNTSERLAAWAARWHARSGAVVDKR